MPDEAKKEAQAAFQEAERFLDEAERLHKAGFPGPCLRSSYYAMYHASLACLRLKGSTPRTHRGTISEFTRLMVKEGHLSQQLSGDLSRMLSERQKSDYEPGLQVDDEKATWALNRARRFLNEARDFLVTQLDDP